MGIGCWIFLVADQQGEKPECGKSEWTQVMVWMGCWMSGS